VGTRLRGIAQFSLFFSAGQVGSPLPPSATDSKIDQVTNAGAKACQGSGDLGIGRAFLLNLAPLATSRTAPDRERVSSHACLFADRTQQAR
jgi:hypothetical protein